MSWNSSFARGVPATGQGHYWDLVGLGVVHGWPSTTTAGYAPSGCGQTSPIMCQRAGSTDPGGKVAASEASVGVDEGLNDVCVDFFADIALALEGDHILEAGTRRNGYRRSEVI